jgi:tryptophanase
MTGFTHILPTHQGRASERILFEVMIGPDGKGKTVPSNGHFDTTRANIEHSGAEARDLPCCVPLQSTGGPESGGASEESPRTPARPPGPALPFKGNMDVKALDELIRATGPEQIPLVMVTVTNNSGGGQPVSLENLRAVRKVCDRYGLPLFLDACRFAENAWFIKTREEGQEGRSVRAIVREMFDLADGATISAKKDGLVNIGGVLLIREPRLFQKASSILILTEGYVTYGGLAGRDLEAMAQGFQEVLEDDYLHYRIRSTQYLGEKLQRAGIGIIDPPGGHAIYIDAKAFCPHIPAHSFPGQAVVCGLYRVGGIRSCEIGSVMFGGDDRPPPKMELVRLAIPRRVYTQSHIDYVAEAATELFAKRHALRPLRITEAPPVLRHFTAKFEEC